jgi:uncharacterized protein (TIGR03435 family)
VKKAFLIFALACAAFAARPSFEVASVKPSAPDDERFYGPRPGGRFVAKKATLKTLVALAYNVREDRILGGPDWLDKDMWSIESKADRSAAMKWPDFWPDPAVSDDPVRQMLESLLEDRFHLKASREMKDAPVFELTVAKNGSKLKTAVNQAADAEGIPHGAMQFNPLTGRLEGHGVPLSRFVLILSGVLGRPVIDKTGLNGAYDFKLEWSPGPAAAPAPPDVPHLTPEVEASRGTIFTAMQEQLGLKVIAAKGPVATVVIDYAAKPGAN